MLVIKIELWPYGRESLKQTLSEGHIINDGTGNSTNGNYKVILKDKAGKVWKTGEVKGFKRKQKIAWYLLYEALKMLLSKK